MTLQAGEGAAGSDAAGTQCGWRGRHACQALYQTRGTDSARGVGVAMQGSLQAVHPYVLP